MSLLNQILNSGDLIIFSIDREYKYLFFNKNHSATMKHIWGVEIEEGVSMLDYINSNDDRAKAKINFDRALAGENFSIIEEYGDEKLNRFFYEDYYSAVYDEDGKVCGVSVYVTDITERKKEALKVEKNERLLDAINENVQEGIYRGVFGKGMVYTNQAFLNMFGLVNIHEIPTELPAQFYVNPEDRTFLIDQIQIGGKISNKEIHFLTKDGQPFWGLVSAIVQTGSNGEVYYDGAIRDISEQKESELKLRSNQNLLESINHNISEGLYRSDEDGIIYVNKAFAEMFGYDSADQVIELKPPVLYKNPEQRERLVELLKKDNYFKNEEIVFLTKNGQEFIGLTSSTSYQDLQGNIFWDGAIRDISKERNANITIKRSEQLLSSINHNINEGLYRSEKGKGLLYVNDEFAKMFGYQSIEDVLNAPSLDLYENPEERKLLGEELVKNGSFTNREIQFKRQDGSTFWGALSSIAIDGEDGQVFFDGAIRDINEQREIREQIKHQNRMQEMLVNVSTRFLNIPLDEVDEAINQSLYELGSFASADRAYIFDFDYGSGLCHNTFEWCADGISPEIENCQNVDLGIMPELVEKLTKGEFYNVSDVTKIGNKAYRSFLIQQNIKSIATVPSMENAKCVGFVGLDFVRTGKEITENETLILSLFAKMLVNIRVRTARQKERKTLLDTTTSQNKRLKDFSYITSHNIRSSVSNILGLIDIQEMEIENHQLTKMLKTSALKLNETIGNINQLLNFEIDLEGLSKVPCNLSESIQHAIDINSETIRLKGIYVKVSCQDDWEIPAFPAFLDSIFLNLLTNAIKYGTTDKSKLIEISIQSRGTGFQIHFTDFGLGIDLGKFADKLFSPGSRFHVQNNEGQGLGLFMVKTQVDAMGGSINVDSKVGLGTTFNLWFDGAK